jgi:hypothetical protein
MQSASVAHCVRHVVPLQPNPPQSTGCGALQLPFASHLPANVAVPLLQLAFPHGTSGPTLPLHVVRTVPSHAAALHALPPVAGEHCIRVLCGWPATGTHVPSAPPTSHASHCPLHGLLQQ